jgi:formylglycine-generating enzyme required for sulfatase activity
LDLPAGMEPNFFGLYGMHGGLWEWCGSWFSEKFSKSEIAGPETGSFRLNRGGSWGLSAASCRSALRVRGVPSARLVYLGFRVARVREAERAAQDGSEPERRS